MKKLLITAFALLAFAAGSQAQTNNKNAKNMMKNLKQKMNVKNKKNI